MNSHELKRVLGTRARDAHKGDFGRLLIIGGSPRYRGALLLATRAALASGVGYVELASYPQVGDYLFASAPEAIAAEAEQIRTNPGFLSRFSAILFGNGLLFPNKEIQKDFDHLVENYSGRLIVDGTGFAYLADYYQRHRDGSVQPELILTPHLKEFATLTGIEVTSRDPLAYRQVAADYLFAHPRTTLVIKSYRTLIKTTRGERPIDGGNSGLAKAGSGDALAGFIAGLAAYNDNFNLEVAAAANTVFYLAATLAVTRCSQASLTASRVIDFLPRALKRYLD